MIRIDELTRFGIHSELERSLEQRLGHQVRDVQDAFSRKGLIAKDIGDYPALIQEANTVPVLVVPRLEEGTSDYLVKLGDELSSPFMVSRGT